jgi:hypothetical protein
LWRTTTPLATAVLAIASLVKGGVLRPLRAVHSHDDDQQPAHGFNDPNERAHHLGQRLV